MAWDGWALGPKIKQAPDDLDEGQKGDVGEWEPFAWQ